MKEKGFTLVELLAVIVILSVISLIAVPMILNVIEESKKGAIRSSVNGIVEAANLYYTQNKQEHHNVFQVLPLFGKDSLSLWNRAFPFQAQINVIPHFMNTHITVFQN